MGYVPIKINLEAAEKHDEAQLAKKEAVEEKEVAEQPPTPTMKPYHSNLMDTFKRLESGREKAEDTADVEARTVTKVEAKRQNVQAHSVLDLFKHEMAQETETEDEGERIKKSEAKDSNSMKAGNSVMNIFKQREDAQRDQGEFDVEYQFDQEKKAEAAAKAAKRVAKMQKIEEAAAKKQAIQDKKLAEEKVAEAAIALRYGDMIAEDDAKGIKHDDIAKGPKGHINLKKEERLLKALEGEEITARNTEKKAEKTRIDAAKVELQREKEEDAARDVVGKIHRDVRAIKERVLYSQQQAIEQGDDRAMRRASEGDYEDA